MDSLYPGRSFYLEDQKMKVSDNEKLQDKQKDFANDQ